MVVVVDAKTFRCVECHFRNVAITRPRLVILPRNFENCVPSLRLLRNVENSMVRFISDPKIIFPINVVISAPVKEGWVVVKDHVRRVPV